MRNDTSRPVMFLGSNSVMYKFTELCELLGIEVAGIMDSDYFGNTESICEVKVVDTEISLSDPVKLAKLKQQYNFFCATNWSPVDNAITQRDCDKRNRLLELIDLYELPTVSLVDPSSRVSKHATIGRGVFIDGQSIVESHCQVKDFSSLHWNVGLGHHTHIGRNTVLHARCSTTANVHIGNDVFMGNHSRVLAAATVADNTWVQTGLWLMRSTVPGEVVGLAGKDLRRVYQQVIVD